MSSRLSPLLLQLPRGGATEEEEDVSSETEQPAATVVDAEDLYLPGLLTTVIERTNKVR